MIHLPGFYRMSNGHADDVHAFVGKTALGTARWGLPSARLCRWDVDSGRAIPAWGDFDITGRLPDRRAG